MAIRWELMSPWFYAVKQFIFTAFVFVCIEQDVELTDKV